MAHVLFHLIVAVAFLFVLRYLSNYFKQLHRPQDKHEAAVMIAAEYGIDHMPVYMAQLEALRAVETALEE
jgi:hypothetical protein